MCHVKENCSFNNKLDEHVWKHWKSYKNFPIKIKMGNVNVRMQKNKDALSGFQIAKLTFDFNTFFDLNKDGYLSYKVRKKSLICSWSYGGSEPPPLDQWNFSRYFGA